MKDGQYDTTHPVDVSAYNAWINAYIGNASEIQIQYMDMTEEHISQIWNGLWASNGLYLSSGSL